MLPLMLLACQPLSGLVSRPTLPDLGRPVPASARVVMDPSLRTAVARYPDACNRPEEVPVGQQLHDGLLEAASRTFEQVQLPGQ